MGEEMCARLGAIGLADADHYGTKAATLGELSQNGLLVPEGYVIAAESFDRYLQENDFPYVPENYGAYSWEIRGALKSYKLPRSLADSISECVDSLRIKYPHDQLIVRTSALCEDTKQSSMAGIFESYPGLSSSEEVCDAVRSCYRALYTDAVLDRFAGGSIQAERLRAAIIIQRLITGDVSGVTFTVDTREMNPGTMKISAVKGPCDGLTDGTQPATTYSVDRQKNTIKKIHGDRDPLEEKVIRNLTNTAATIEEIAGYYQDIEWTIAGNTLYVLQARPVTGFRKAMDPEFWEMSEETDPEKLWELHSNRSLPPLLRELAVKSENLFGECAYSYGMDWDAYEFMTCNGYIYKRTRHIPDAKKRIGSYIKRLSAQFDRGEDEYDKFIKPELAALISSIDKKYIGRELSLQDLLVYLDDAERYMNRSSRLHWRATTSEWYMGHFFRKRVEKFYDSISAQDLVDMVYSKSYMTEERERVYKMIEVVRSDPDLRELFTETKFERIIESRLSRLNSPPVRRLLDLMDEYSTAYGWLYDGNFDDGLLPPIGAVSILECIRRIRRYLHISISDYRKNLAHVAANAKRLRELGFSKCESDEEKAKLEMAIKAGEKAYLAGDNHALHICSRKFVYVSDALRKIGAAFQKLGILDKQEDIRFLYLDEIRSAVSKSTDLKEIIADRKTEHQMQGEILPPKHIGKAEEAAPDATATGKANRKKGEDPPTVIKGESGTQTNAIGPVQLDFPDSVPENDFILVLEHGHEGDLTTVLGHVKGLIMKMGTPACHMGIIARELGIPAVYGIGDNVNHLKQGDIVELRGESGEIILPAR